MAEILSIVCRRTSGPTLRASCLLRDHLVVAAGNARDHEPPPLRARDRQHAAVLVRALLHAASCNPAFERRDQDVLLKQLGDVLPSDRAALRAVVATPEDVASHASAVPIGLEREVYAVSLLALGEGSPSCDAYLRDLASGLRLRHETRSRIHAEIGAGPPAP